MSTQQQITQITWDGINLSVGFISEWPICDFCHIEVKCDQPLPITETGYKSHFMDMRHLGGYADHIAYVKAWLDDAAQSKEWKRYVEQSRQGDLFAS